MSFSIENITKKQWAWAFGILALLVVGYIAFNEIQKASWKSKLEKELANLDLKMSTGKLSAAELVDLKLKKNAIINQYLKTL